MADALGIQDTQNAKEANFTGLVFPYAGGGVPAGFLLCDGSAVSRTTYARLFSVIGTTYGAGDGSTTFNVPDLRGSVIVGAGQRVRSLTFNGASGVDPATDQITVASNDWLFTGQAVALSGSSLPTGLSAGTYYAIRISATVAKLASTLANAVAGIAVNITADGSGTCTLTQTLTDRSLGTTGGEESHSLTISELPSHTHTAVNEGSNPNGDDFAGGSGPNQINTSGATGGNTAMNVMSPYTVLNFVIKT